MIEKVECVMLECDNCKEPFEDYNGFSIFIDENMAHERADSSGWEMHAEGGKHYCEKCHHYNDEDQLIINSERTKTESTAPDGSKEWSE